MELGEEIYRIFDEKREPLFPRQVIEELIKRRPELQNRRESLRRNVTNVIRKLYEDGKIKKLDPSKGKRSPYVICDYVDEEGRLKVFLKGWDSSDCTKGLLPPIDEAIKAVGLNPDNPSDRDKVHGLFSKLKRGYSGPIPLEVRIRHSDELRGLIEAWLEEIPTITEDLRLKVPLRPDFKGGDREIAVEKYPLFEDLRCHLPKRIFDRWKGIKELAKPFWDYRGKLERRVREIVLMDFRGFGFEEREANIWRDVPPNSIWEGLIIDILREGIGVCPDRFRNALEGELEVEDRRDGCKLIRSLGVYYAVVEPRWGGEGLGDWFKGRLEAALGKVYDECSQELEKFKGIVEELKKLTEIIHKELAEEKAKPILWGYCKYLCRGAA